MNNLGTIHQKDVFPYMSEPGEISYAQRYTGKAIILDREGYVALISNNVNNFLQLPGGGIDDGEEITDGIVRESLEETGCDIRLMSEVGIINDYRARDKKCCITVCYTAKVIGDKGKNSLTDTEIEIGMSTLWLKPLEVLSIFQDQVIELEKGNVEFYNTGFNILRDYKFFNEAVRAGLIYV